MTQQDIFIKMVLDAWHTHIKRADDLFNSLSDEQLLKEIAPGRNRGIYLLGHLAAVHDKMLPVLGFGNPINLEFYRIFVERPDKAITELPSILDLRLYSHEVNKTLAGHLNQL